LGLDPLLQSDEIDNALAAQAEQARKRFNEFPTPENREECRRAVRQLADWVLRGLAPDSAAHARQQF